MNTGNFILFYFIIIIIFYFTILYWFCHTSTCIRHRCTCVPHPEPPSHPPRHTIPLGHPSAPAPSFLYPASSLTGDSFLIWYYTCFNAIVPLRTKILSNSEYANLITLIKGMFWNQSSTNYIPAESLKKCSILA